MRILVLNPRGEVSLDNFLAEEEIDEIVSRLASGVQSQLSKIRSSPYIVKSNESGNH
jgi:hypothetical protein